MPYIIENNRKILEVEIISDQGNLCTVRFKDRNGGTRIPKSRIFNTEQAAIEALPDNNKPKIVPKAEDNRPEWKKRQDEILAHIQGNKRNDC